MTFTYDSRGHLVPSQSIETTVEEFKKACVDVSSTDSHRSKNYSNYLEFNRRLFEITDTDTESLKQWIDGSYINPKVDAPNDIDIVIFVPFDIVIANERSINLLREYAKHELNIDTYIISVYPEGHRWYSRTLSDSLQWETEIFGVTRRNRGGKRFKKGFLSFVVKNSYDEGE